MFTKRHQVKAARVMHDYGEPRPGSLDHDAAALTGPWRDRSLTNKAASKTALKLTHKYDFKAGTVLFEEE